MNFTEFQNFETGFWKMSQHNILRHEKHKQKENKSEKINMKIHSVYYSEENFYAKYILLINHLTFQLKIIFRDIRKGY